MKPLDFTLIGAGGYGGTHLHVLRLLEEEGCARLTDVVDPSPERLPAVHDALKARGVRWHRTWEDRLLAAPPSACVTIAAPIHLHFDYARLAYASGAYVYMEKPPVPLLGQMEELIAMETGGGARIQVGFTFPYSDQVGALARWIEGGRLGRILSYRLTACCPRPDAYYSRNPWAGKVWLGDQPVLDGPATNALAHRIHDLLWIERAACGRFVPPSVLCAELYRARPIESYDVCALRGEFASGAVFGITLSHAVAVETGIRVEITGSRGQVRLGGPQLAMEADFASGPIATSEPLLHRAYRDFIATAREGRRPTVGLAETLPYVVTTNAMCLSSGAIHPIGRAHWNRAPLPEGGAYEVHGLDRLSQRAFETGLNFSELQAPWGVPGRAVSPPLISAAEALEQIAAFRGAAKPAGEPAALCPAFSA